MSAREHAETLVRLLRIDDKDKNHWIAIFEDHLYEAMAESLICAAHCLERAPGWGPGPKQPEERDALNGMWLSDWLRERADQYTNRTTRDLAPLFAEENRAEGLR